MVLSLFGRAARSLLWSLRVLFSGLWHACRAYVASVPGRAYVSSPGRARVVSSVLGRAYVSSVPGRARVVASVVAVVCFIVVFRGPLFFCAHARARAPAHAQLTLSRQPPYARQTTTLRSASTDSIASSQHLFFFVSAGFFCSCRYMLKSCHHGFRSK